MDQSSSPVSSRNSALSSIPSPLDMGQLHRVSQPIMALFYVFRQSLFGYVYDTSKATVGEDGAINIYAYDEPSKRRIQKYVRTPGFTKDQNAADFTSRSCWMPSEMFTSLLHTILDRKSPLSLSASGASDTSSPLLRTQSASIASLNPKPHTNLPPNLVEKIEEWQVDYPPAFDHLSAHSLACSPTEPVCRAFSIL